MTALGPPPQFEPLLGQGPLPGAGASQRLSDSQLHRLRGLLPRESSLHPAGAAPAAPPTQPAWPAVPGYEVLRELGRGGMAVVYEARQLILNRRVALKMIRAAELATPEQLVRFCAEGEIVASLRHPNIVQIYEVGTYKGQPSSRWSCWTAADWRRPRPPSRCRPARRPG
jgi:serine/threonine protein kinase